MKNSFDEKVKGHGFFRKTKAFGLASGIALGAALLIGANTVSADEATSAQPTTTAQPTNSDAKSEVVTVKEAELKAKVDEAKKTGVEVVEKPAVSVGTATNDADAKKLEAEATKKVDSQIKALDDAKKLVESNATKAEDVNEYKSSLLSSPILPDLGTLMVNHIQTTDSNSGKVSTVSNISSTKGEVKFVNADKIGGEGYSADDFYSKLNSGFSSNPKLVDVYNNVYYNPDENKTTADKAYNNIASHYSKKYVPMYVVKVSDGEKISYDVDVNPSSELFTKYNISKVRRTLSVDGVSYKNPNTDGMFIGFNSYLGQDPELFLAVGKDSDFVVGNKFKVLKATQYFDKNGKAVDIDALTANVINNFSFQGKEIVTSSEVNKALEEKKNHQSKTIENSKGILLKSSEEVDVKKDVVTETTEFKLNSGKVTPDTTGLQLAISFSVAYPTPYSGDLNGVNDRPKVEVSPVTYTRTTAITTTYVPNDKLNPNETKVTDDGKQSGKKVIEVGTKPSEKVEEIPFKEETRPNPTLPEGERKVVQEGVKGRKVTRTTYTLDAKTGKVTPKEEVTENTAPKNRIVEVGTKKLNTEQPDAATDGELVTVYRPNDKLEAGKQNEVDPGKKSKLVNGKETEPGKPRIIEVGTKPVVVEKEIPFKETVVQNPSKPEGTRTVLKEGKVGKETTTTTYTLDTKTGKVTPDTKTAVVKAEDRLVEVGTGKNVTGKDVETQYVPDPELEPGKTKVVQEGTPEVKDVTGKVVTPGKPTIIHIGTKPKVVEEEVPFKEETRENKDLPKGERKVVQEGKAGKKVTTTTYMVDPKTGKVTSEDKVEETAAVNKIIEVGTKEEAKATPAPQTPAKPQAPAAPKAQLPHTGTEASLALSIAGLAVAGIATTMVLKKKEQ